MMHEFLSLNRAELIQRCREKVARRPAPKASDEEFKHGVPLFLDQLIKTLRVEQTGGAQKSQAVSGPASGLHVLSELGESAARHGDELMLQGFTIDQVVHDYGACVRRSRISLSRRAQRFKSTNFEPSIVAWITQLPAR